MRLFGVRMKQMGLNNKNKRPAPSSSFIFYYFISLFLRCFLTGLRLFCCCVHLRFFFSSTEILESGAVSYIFCHFLITHCIRSILLRTIFVFYIFYFFVFLGCIDVRLCFYFFCFLFFCFCDPNFHKLMRTFRPDSNRIPSPEL